MESNYLCSSAAWVPCSFASMTVHTYTYTYTDTNTEDRSNTAQNSDNMIVMSFK